MKKIILFAFFILSLISCSQQEEKNQLFSIIDNNDGYIVKIKDKYTYILSRSGKKGTIKIPVKKVVVLSSTHIGFISALNEEKSIIGLSGKNFVYNPILRKRIDSIAEIGVQGSLNIEKILTLKPDVVFIYTLNQESQSKINRLKQAGIAVVPIYEFMENDPLKRSRWIEVFGVFFDKYAQAQRIWYKISNSYNFYKKNVHKYLKQAGVKRVKILVNIPYRGIWYVPSGNSYMAKLIDDAGGYYPWANTKSKLSLPLDFETVFSKAADADILINPNTATSVEQILETDQRLEKFKAIRQRHVYNFTKKISPSGGFAFWENGVVEPDKILHDLILIFYPNITFANDSLYYYQKLE